MFLALDVGNSAVKGALFEGASRARVFSVSAGADTPAAWGRALAPHLEAAAIDAVGVASVVPARANAVTAALGARTDAPITRVGPDAALPFELAYETPNTLGADRLAAAAAGWARFGASGPRSVIVVDAGTAVTCEVVHREGVYRGGTIAAGPALTRRALRAGTAQLPDVPLALPDDPVGRSTQSALQSGVMWGLVDGVCGMADRLAATLPDTPVVVLTGGWGELLADPLDADHHRPHLVLEGVRLLTAATAD
jgi:type III pantothenate kinase